MIQFPVTLNSRDPADFEILLTLEEHDNQTSCGLGGFITMQSIYEELVSMCTLAFL